MPEVDVVTGAFGYTGRYITARLLESGRSVRTLTGHPNRPNPFGDRVAVAAFDFEDRRKLAGHHVPGAWLADVLARLQVRYPEVQVVFADSRKFAEEWTYRFLAAALADATGAGVE